MFYEAAEARKDHPVIIEPLSGVPVFDDRGHDHDQSKSASHEVIDRRNPLAVSRSSPTQH